MQQKTGLTFSTESRNLRGRANCNVKRKRHAIQLCTHVRGRTDVFFIYLSINDKGH